MNSREVKPGIWRTAKIAREILNQQPFTAACRARHEIVPCFERNLLGEKLSTKPIGWVYRLRA